MDQASTASSKPKKSNDTSELRNDNYCWLCHKERCNLSCGVCPRSYHLKCINNNASYSQLDSFSFLNDKKTFIKENWVCFECELIAKAESDEGKSECLRRITKDEFCELLTHAYKSIKKSVDLTFHSPVNTETYQDYLDFIVHPMDFYKIEQYIQTKKYASTEAFLSDCKWILHNCYIYNQASNPLTANAKYMIKQAKNEMYELETCPDCYKNFYTTSIKEFFIQTCSYPHNLCFAKLKGFPLWPSKIVKYNATTDEAEVRFFGAYDKAWISLDNCYLLSEKPNASKVSRNQRGKLDTAIKELEAHLELLNKRFPGVFKYHPPKTTLKPDQIYLIPLPDHIKAPSSSKDHLKDNSIINQSLDQSDQSIVQPPKKQQKRTSVTSISSSKSTTPSRTSNKRQQLAEKDEEHFSDSLSMNEDSDDHKLVIDDSNSDKKQQISKRKRTDSSSSAPKNVITPAKPNNSSVIVEQTESRTPIPPKKKSRKTVHETSNTPSNLPTKSYQQVSPNSDSDKVEQLIKQVKYFKDELDRVRSIHIAEIKEMFENHKSEFRDLKTTMDEEKEKELKALRKELEQQHSKQIEEIKKKSWCTNCLKEASYFCCRLASYCSYACQSEHWIKHLSTCLQNKEKSADTTSTVNEQQEEQVDEKLVPEKPLPTSESKEDENKSIETEKAESIDKPIEKLDEKESGTKETKVDNDKKSEKEFTKVKDKPLAEVVKEEVKIKQPSSKTKLVAEKPKDRFLKKLNEKHKLNQSLEKKIEKDDLSKEQDKKTAIRTDSKEEEKKIDKDSLQDQSQKSETNLNKEEKNLNEENKSKANNELLQLRQNLLKQLGERQKKNDDSKEKHQDDKSTEDKNKLNVLKIDEERDDDKLKNSKPVDNESMDLDDRQDRKEIDEEDFDDDEALMNQIISKGLKSSDKDKISEDTNQLVDQVEKKEASLSEDVNLIEDKNETSTQSSIQSEVRKVKDDLIKMVEDELNN